MDRLGGPTRPVLCFRNRQRRRAIDLARLRRWTLWLLREGFQAGRVELCFHLVASAEIARVNEAYLGHLGPTDVITFDYRRLTAAPVGSSDGTSLTKLGTFWGEIYICIDEAVTQARRFRVTWQSELARYVIHGLLHLAGHDDQEPALRRTMKREEDRLLRLAPRYSSLASPARRRTRGKGGGHP